MIVKQDEKQLSFLFEVEDAYFELGYTILAQEHFTQMLPYKRGEVRGKEKLMFQVKKYQPLMTVLPTLSENEVIDVLYTLCSMTRRVEVSRLLKKECIWCCYEHLYFDENTRGLKMALLPVASEVLLKEGESWSEHFLRTIKLISAVLAPVKQQQVLALAKELIENKRNGNLILQDLDALGSGLSGILAGTKEEQDKYLTLYYSGVEGTIQFSMKKDSFRLGKSEDEVDGVISISPAVSRLHCLIIKQNQKFFVQDLNSVNHTFVNGDYIPPYEFMELEDNDILAVADVAFRVHIK